MDPFHFACPHCLSRLRVREKLYVGRQVDCPECGDTLLIVERAGELAVERVERQPSAAPPAGKSAQPGQQEVPSKKTGEVTDTRSAAASQTTGSSAGAAPGVAPRGQTLVQRLFADRRRAIIALGISSALVAILLVIIYGVRSAGQRDAADEPNPEIAADNSATPLANAAGERPVGDIPQPAPARGKRSDEEETRRPMDEETPLNEAESPMRDARAVPPAGDDALAGEPDVGEPDADDRPIDPDFAPEPTAPPARKIDLALALKQPIARFDQPRSKPLEEVLASVAEMAGARIMVDRDELGPAAARLAEPMALRLENTTVGEILIGLLRPAGLDYRIEGDHLHIIREEDE